MTGLSSLALTGGTQVGPTPAGVEISNARRLIDFGDVTFARCSYGGGGVGDLAVGVSYSPDGGVSWQPLVPIGPPLSAGTVLASAWTQVQWLNGDVLVAPIAYGTSLLGLYSLSFVELQLR